MTREQLSNDPADVVRDAKALTDFIKGRNLQVLQAGVRPYVEVCFFAHGKRDTITEFFLELAEILIDPELTVTRVQGTVMFTATGGYKDVSLSAKLHVGDYESALLVRELRGVAEVEDHVDVPTSREALESAVVLLSTHADDCDGTCQQYGQVPCYADRAL
jgi:hypothetical protein